MTWFDKQCFAYCISTQILPRLLPRYCTDLALRLQLDFKGSREYIRLGNLLLKVLHELLISLLVERTTQVKRYILFAVNNSIAVLQKKVTYETFCFISLRHFYFYLIEYAAAILVCPKRSTVQVLFVDIYSIFPVAFLQYNKMEVSEFALAAVKKQ